MSSTNRPAKTAPLPFLISLCLAFLILTTGCETDRGPDQPATEQAILVIGGAGDSDMPFTDIAMAWIPSRDSWYRLAEMPTERRAMAYSVHEGRLYVIGGWTGEPQEEAGPGGLVPLDVVEIFDPVENRWESGTPMPTPRGKMAHMYPAVNGQIPVAGGERYQERLSEAAIYHIERDEWEVINDLPETWTFPYVMANPLEPNLVHFAAGNTDTQENMQDWHTLLDMETREWHHRSRAPYPIEITDGDGSIFYDDKWWTFGGWSHELGSVIDVYAYDFAEDRWEEMPHPPFDSWSHQGASVAEIDGQERIFMMGGRINGELTDRIWQYDGHEWSPVDSRMPVALWNFIAVTMEINPELLEPID